MKISKNFKEFVKFITAMTFAIGMLTLFVWGIARDPVKSYKIVTAKTIEYSNGILSKGTYYVLGFNDKSTQYTTFGIYSGTNIGDTIFYNH